LGTGTGGIAAADTAQCGIEYHGAALIPNDGGKVLLAGGDLSAAGDVLLSPGESSNLSFIFDPTTQTFSQTTGSMATPREVFALTSSIFGPITGEVVAFGGIESNSNVCTNPTTPLVATTLNTAEAFDPSTQTWSPAGTMNVKRAGAAAIVPSTGTLAGEVILAGGTDLEAGTLPATCVALANVKQAAQSETDAYSGVFVNVGSFNQARETPGFGVIGAGIDFTEILVAGGACTTPAPSLQSVTIGTSQAATTCGSASAQNDYSELYIQAANIWTVGPAAAPGYTPANAPASAALP